MLRRLLTYRALIPSLRRSRFRIPVSMTLVTTVACVAVGAAMADLGAPAPRLERYVAAHTHASDARRVVAIRWPRAHEVDVYVGMRASPESLRIARRICRVAIAGVRNLPVRGVSVLYVVGVPPLPGATGRYASRILAEAFADTGARCT